MKEQYNNILKRITIFFSLVVSILVLFTIVDEKATFADSGFDTSYDSGGSWDSGSSWDSGRSWDSSYNIYDDEGEGSFGGFLIGLIIFAIIFAISYFISGSTSNTKPPLHTTNTPINYEEIENQIKQYLPNFNKEEFLQQGYKIYCDVQNAWMNFKLEDVRDIITDELYTMYKSQLTTLEVKGEQNVMKDFVLKNKFIKGVEKQNDTITISTVYVIEFYDYIAEQSSGKVIRGTADRKMRVKYEMKFRQTLDESKKITKCPNCGADIEMNTSSICDYCHTKLVTENTKWVLTEKKTLDQEYAY